MTPRVRSAALAIVLASAATTHAQVNVTGAWNFCLDPTAQGVQRPTGTLTQVGDHVTGTIRYTFFQSFINCTVAFDLDSATGAFVPGTATEQCPFNVTVGLRPAITNGDRIDGEFGTQPFNRTAFFGLRACDPLVAGACDDGDPATTDTCSTTVDCSGVAIPPSCVHTGCTADADCADAFGCTIDRCDSATGCGHPVLLQPGAPAAFCEDADACTINTMCELALCGAGPFTAVVTEMVQPKVTLGRLGMPGGDDTLVVKGRVVLPSPLTIKPAENGIRVLLTDASGAIVADERLSGGAFDPLTGVGWLITGSGVRYLDKRKIDPGPIKKVTIKSDLGTAGLVRFSITGKAGSYLASPALPLGVFVNLDPDGLSPSDPLDPSPLDGGACASFAGAPPLSCTASSNGTKVRCR